MKLELSAMSRSCSTAVTELSCSGVVICSHSWALSAFLSSAARPASETPAAPRNDQRPRLDHRQLPFHREQQARLRAADHAGPLLVALALAARRERVTFAMPDDADRAVVGALAFADARLLQRDRVCKIPPRVELGTAAVLV